MESTKDRIDTLGKIAEDALELSRDYMRTAAEDYYIDDAKVPRNDALLVDPTYKSITPPSQPDSPAFDADFPETPEIGEFSDSVPSPPVLQGATEGNDYSEEKVSWLLDLPNRTNGIDSTKEAIEKLFNETDYYYMENNTVKNIEDSEFAVGNEKDLQKLSDEGDSVVSVMAARGFTMPNDIIDREMEKLDVAYDESRLGRNLKIYLTQMDKAQKNAHFGINTGLDGESLLMSYYSGIARRSLDAATSTVGLGLELFNARTRQYNAELRGKRTAMQGAVEVESSKINNYMETISANEQRLSAYVVAISSLKGNYRNALRGYRAEISSERARAGVTMSWRKGQYRESLAKITAELSVDISNMMSYFSAGKLNMHVDSASAMYYVHYLSALLSSLQVIINESQAFEENVITT